MNGQLFALSLLLTGIHVWLAFVLGPDLRRIRDAIEQLAKAAEAERGEHEGKKT